MSFLGFRNPGRRRQKQLLVYQTPLSKFFKGTPSPSRGRSPGSLPAEQSGGWHPCSLQSHPQSRARQPGKTEQHTSRPELCPWKAAAGGVGERGAAWLRGTAWPEEDTRWAAGRWGLTPGTSSRSRCTLGQVFAAKTATGSLLCKPPVKLEKQKEDMESGIDPSESFCYYVASM